MCVHRCNSNIKEEAVTSGVEYLGGVTGKRRYRSDLDAVLEYSPKILLKAKGEPISHAHCW